MDPMALDKPKNLHQLPQSLKTPTLKPLQTSMTPQAVQRASQPPNIFDFSPLPLKFPEKKRKITWTPKQPTFTFASSKDKDLNQLLQQARVTMLQAARLSEEKKDIGHAIFYLDQARSTLGLQSLRRKGELENEDLYIKPQDLESKIDQVLLLLDRNHKGDTSSQPLPQQQLQQRTWAQVTTPTPTQLNQGEGAWTLVQGKLKTVLKPDNFRDRRVVITLDQPITNLEAMQTRDTINLALKAKGVQKEIVATVSVPLSKKSIVLTTTPLYKAEDLLKYQDTWKQLLGIQTQAVRKDTQWHKVVVHGIPTKDFKDEAGLALV